MKRVSLERLENFTIAVGAAGAIVTAVLSIHNHPMWNEIGAATFGFVAAALLVRYLVLAGPHRRKR